MAFYAEKIGKKVNISLPKRIHSPWKMTVSPLKGKSIADTGNETDSRHAIYRARHFRLHAEYPWGAPNMEPQDGSSSGLRYMSCPKNHLVHKKATPAKNKFF